MRNVATEMQSQYKVDLSSFTKAVRQFQSWGWQDSRFQMEDFILEVVGKPIPAATLKDVQITCGYVIQETVKLHLAGSLCSQDEIVDVVTAKVAKYKESHPWDFLPPAEGDWREGMIPTRQDRAPKGSGMSKKERSVSLYLPNKDKSRKELIAIFVAELGLSEAGASTYVHNCKKGIWK